MNKHLSMRSGNPALSSSTFKNVATIGDEKMSIEGTVNKTALSLLLLMSTASYSWMNPSVGLMMLGFIGGFIMALATILKKTWAPYTVSGYALLEGLALGGISSVFESLYPGIASQAIFLTFGILAALLLAYKTGVIKPTENFKLGVFAATGGIAIMFVLPWLDRSKVKSIRYKGIYFKIAIAIFVVSFIVLGYLGLLPVTPLRTILARIFTITYFLFFLLMPFYSKWEKTKPLPDRVS